MAERAATRSHTMKSTNIGTTRGSKGLVANAKASDRIDDVVPMEVARGAFCERQAILLMGLMTTLSQPGCAPAAYHGEFRADSSTRHQGGVRATMRSRKPGIAAR